MRLQSADQRILTFHDGSIISFRSSLIILQSETGNQYRLSVPGTFLRLLFLQRKAYQIIRRLLIGAHGYLRYTVFLHILQKFGIGNLLTVYFISREQIPNQYHKCYQRYSPKYQHQYIWLLRLVSVTSPVSVIAAGCISTVSTTVIILIYLIVHSNSISVFCKISFIGDNKSILL